MSSMRRGPLWPVLVVAFGTLGVAVSILSTMDHFTFVTSGGHGFCAAISDSACRGAHSSPAAEIRGIPISILGMSFYIGFIVSALLAWRIGRRNAGSWMASIPTLLAIASALSVGYSAYLASLLLAAGDWCPFCATLYGVNTALLALSLAWAWPEIRRPSLSALAGCAVVFGAITMLAAVPAYSWYAAEVDTARAMAANREKQPGAYEHFHLPDLPKRLPSKGSPTAPASIIEFSDFECPFCAAMHKVISTLFAQVGPKRLRVRFVNFPLDNSCNCYVAVCVHKNACLAARASI
ncbi:MAG: thioredoxin domain-containing protein, partial [Deltaproteobacteria bacterium]|nr:thioredoxin domain-containing protein [Deltaproteobacteria bacterium]